MGVNSSLHAATSYCCFLLVHGPVIPGGGRMGSGTAPRGRGRAKGGVAGSEEHWTWVQPQDRGSEVSWEDERSISQPSSAPRCRQQLATTLLRYDALCGFVGLKSVVHHESPWIISKLHNVVLNFYLLYSNENNRVLLWSGAGISKLLSLTHRKHTNISTDQLLVTSFHSKRQTSQNSEQRIQFCISMATLKWISANKMRLMMLYCSCYKKFEGHCLASGSIIRMSSWSGVWNG